MSLPPLKKGLAFGGLGAVVGEIVRLPMVMSRRLQLAAPIEPAAMDNRQIIEWVKDDVEALKMMKVDILALGMLTCVSKPFALINQYKDDPLNLASVKREDGPTHPMIRKADTSGTFQVESRAQMAMLPRLKPRTFYDFLIQVAIVRRGSGRRSRIKRNVTLWYNISHKHIYGTLTKFNKRRCRIN
jgi:DNA polymerase III alpha subunit